MRRLILALLLLLPLLAVPLFRGGGSLPSLRWTSCWRRRRGTAWRGRTAWEAGARSILSAAGAQLDGLIRRSLRLGLKLMAVVLLCGLAEGPAWRAGPAGSRRWRWPGPGGHRPDGERHDGDGGPGAGNHRQDGRFSGLLLPAMATLTAATGGSPARQCGRVPPCCAPVCSSGGIDGLLVPLLYAYIAACCAHAALGSDGLKKLAALIKGTIVFLLTAGLLVFVGYLTASGAIAGSADAAAVKAAKMTISRAIPVVGGILSDAAETVLAGAGVLRGHCGGGGDAGGTGHLFDAVLQLALHYPDL